MGFVLDKGSFLYHGSGLNLRTLQPHRSKLVGGQKVVFATPFRGVALCFCSHTWTDDMLDLGLVNGRPTLQELRKGALNFFKIPGYLYTLSGKGFESDPRLGGFELVKKEAVTPLEVNYFPNVLDQLRLEDIDIVEY